MYVKRTLILVMLTVSAVSLAACGTTRADVPPTQSYGNPTPTARPTATAKPTVARPTAAPAGGNNAPAPTGDNVVTFSEKDFAIDVDKSSVKSGMVVLYVKNAGPSPHNVQITVNGAMQATKTINMGETDQLMVNLPPGMYTFICNVPGHEQLGMKGTLTAT